MTIENPHGVTVTLIAAVDEGGLIGVGNDLPWKCPVDHARFKRLTYYPPPTPGADSYSKPLILGRTTFDCIFHKYGYVLPGRRLFVMSRKPMTELNKEIGFVRRTPEDALEMAAMYARSAARSPGPVYQPPEVLVIGGAQVYKEFLPVADRVYLTTVDGTYGTGTGEDVYMPDLKAGDWKVAYQERFQGDIHGRPGHLFEVLVRRG